MASKRKTASQEAQKNHFNLQTIEPLTQNQQKAFDEYDTGNHLVLTGSAGTGKSFIALYLALQDILDPDSYYNKIIIVRSAVPTRDLGFLPGTLEEKVQTYQEPYKRIVDDLMSRGDAYSILMNREIIEFQTTSFLRGLTFKDCIIIFDEIQSATFHELDTVLTRIGENCKFIFCGDYKQNDLNNKKEKSGFQDIMQILENVANVKRINFNLQDVVRSGFVRDYLTAKEKLNI